MTIDTELEGLRYEQDTEGRSEKGATIRCENQDEVETVADEVETEGYFTTVRRLDLATSENYERICSGAWYEYFKYLMSHVPKAAVLDDMNLIATELNDDLNRNSDGKAHGKCIAVTFVRHGSLNWTLLIGCNGPNPRAAIPLLNRALARLRPAFAGQWLKSTLAQEYFRRPELSYLLTPGWMQWTHAELRILQWMLTHGTLKASHCCGFVGTSLPVCMKCSYIFYSYNAWATRTLFEKLSTREGHLVCEDNWEFGKLGSQAEIAAFVDWLDPFELDILNVLG